MLHGDSWILAGKEVNIVLPILLAAESYITGRKREGDKGANAWRKNASLYSINGDLQFQVLLFPLSSSTSRQSDIYSHSHHMPQSLMSMKTNHIVEKSCVAPWMKHILEPDLGPFKQAGSTEDPQNKIFYAVNAQQLVQILSWIYCGF